MRIFWTITALTGRVKQMPAQVLDFIAFVAV
jgi:hypothetical protein